MDAGKLDQPIYFESAATVNIGGEATTSFTDASGNSPRTPDWAMIITQKGSEAIESARQNARETVRGVVRYRSDVKVTWRFDWNGQYYYIQSVDESKKRKNELWFTAELTGAP